MLSRVQALSQIFILESVCPEKITSSMSAMDELERMERDAINLKVSLKNSIISCNIRSLRKNFDNFFSASSIKRANVMCLQETWLDPSAEECNLLTNSGWTQHNNSVGKGKGITTLFADKYEFGKDIKNPNYQFTQIVSESLDIINVYRSEAANSEDFIEDLFGITDGRKQTLILGDFNICYLTENSHSVYQAINSRGYHQIVKSPTSLHGRLIDVAFLSPSNSDVHYEAKQQSQFFTDHDLIEIIEGK